MNDGKQHCVESARFRSFPGPYLPAFGLNTERYSVQMRKDTDQKNSEYGHLSRSTVNFCCKNSILDASRFLDAAMVVYHINDY